MYSVTVENDFRNTKAHIEFRWYTDVVTRFEAYLVSGSAPKDSYHGNIKIMFNDKVIGTYTRKEDALGHVRQILIKCPTECKKDFLLYSKYLESAITGVL